MVLINDDLEYSVFLPRSKDTFKFLDRNFEYNLDNDDFSDNEIVFVSFNTAEEALTAVECCTYSSRLVH